MRIDAHAVDRRCCSVRHKIAAQQEAYFTVAHVGSGLTHTHPCRAGKNGVHCDHAVVCVVCCASRRLPVVGLDGALDLQPRSRLPG